MRHAQTILQLFAQMREQGLSEEQMVAVRRGYEVGMRLLSGLYTRSGKPTLDHHVGVASAGLRHNTPLDLVLAGLLHGVYSDGGWGHYLRRPNEAKRRVIREVAGTRGEACVHAITYMRWNTESIPKLRRQLDTLTAADRDAVLVKLLDMVDFLTDGGGVYLYRDMEDVRRWMAATREDQVWLAEQTCGPMLAKEIDELIAATLTYEPPAGLRSLPIPSGPPLIFVSHAYRRRRLLHAFQTLGIRGREWLAAWRG